MKVRITSDGLGPCWHELVDGKGRAWGSDGRRRRMKGLLALRKVVQAPHVAASACGWLLF